MRFPPALFPSLMDFSPRAAVCGGLCGGSLRWQSAHLLHSFAHGAGLHLALSRLRRRRTTLGPHLLRSFASSFSPLRGSLHHSFLFVFECAVPVGISTPLQAEDLRIGTQVEGNRTQGLWQQVRGIETTAANRKEGAIENTIVHQTLQNVTRALPLYKNAWSFSWEFFCSRVT